MDSFNFTYFPYQLTLQYKTASPLSLALDNVPQCCLQPLLYLNVTSILKQPFSLFVKTILYVLQGSDRSLFLKTRHRQLVKKSFYVTESVTPESHHLSYFIGIPVGFRSHVFLKTSAVGKKQNSVTVLCFILKKTLKTIPIERPKIKKLNRLKRHSIKFKKSEN